MMIFSPQVLSLNPKSSSWHCYFSKTWWSFYFVFTACAISAMNFRSRLKQIRAHRAKYANHFDFCGEFLWFGFFSFDLSSSYQYYKILQNMCEDERVPYVPPKRVWIYTYDWSILLKLPRTISQLFPFEEVVVRQRWATDRCWYSSNSNFLVHYSLP